MILTKKHNNVLGKTVFRLRGGIWTALFLLILILADPVFANILPAVSLVIAGQLMRIWASGTIGLYRGEKVKAERLVTYGPYALMRNPLYFANGLIGAGWSIMAGLYASVAFILVFFVVYNLCIIPHEEQFLEKKFNGAYLDYKKKTGRFFPRELSMKDIKAHFDPQVIIRSETHSMLVSFAGTFLLVSRIWW